MNKVGEFLRAVGKRDPGAVYIVVKTLFGFGTGFFGSTYMLFLMRYLGDEAVANSVNMWFMAGIVVFEIPTGAIADVFGRKISTVFGLLFWGLGSLVYFVSQSYRGFVYAELCAAMGLAMISGALVSWMIDWVGEKRSGQVLSSGEAASRIISIPSKILGGSIGSYGLEMPWLLSGLALLGAAFVAAVLMRSEPEISSVKERQNLKTLVATMKDGFRCVPRSRVLALMVPVIGIQAISLWAFNMFWPLVFSEHLGGPRGLGKLFALVNVALALGSYLSKQMLTNGRLCVLGMVLAELVVGGFILLGTTFPITWILVVTFLLHEIGRGMFLPLFTSFTNKYIPSEIRATVNSMISMVEKIGAFLGLWISGLIASRFGPLIAWKVSAILILLTIPFLIAAGRRDGN